MGRRTSWQEKRRRPPSNLRFFGIVGLLIGAGGGWWLTLPDARRGALLVEAQRDAEESVQSLSGETRPYRYFAGCDDARRAGYENIDINEPSYRAIFDGDNDGIGCEPYYG